MRLSATLQKIGSLIFLGTVFLLPLFFLPITSEFYEFNKLVLIVLSASIMLLIWTGSMVLNRQVRLVRSPLGLPLLALAGAWILSTLLKTPNRVDALIEPGQTSTIIALVVFFFTSINLIRTKKELETAIYVLLASIGLLAIITLLWGTGLLPQIIPVAFAKIPTWTPTGTPLGTLLVFIILLPLQVILILRDKGNSTKTLLLSLSLLGSVIAGGVMTYRLFASESVYRPAFLPQSAGWAIALEAIKVSPLLGTGPSTFLSDFSRFRPINFNLTPYWNVRFSSASNYYLQLISTVGILGIAAYIFVVSKSARLFIHALKSTSESPFRMLALACTASLMTLFVLQLATPVSLITMFIGFLLLILIVVSFRLMGSSLVHEDNIDIVAATDTGIRSPILPWIGFGLSLLLIIPTFYGLFRVYQAELHFQKALLAAAENQGKPTYDNLLAAMRANPFKDSYRVAYSQTNLLIANSSATQENLTNEDRQTITTLIQQAIREAKNAVALNPTKVTNVENLAAVYRNLVSFAEGADVWTVASYRQAIQLDPVNPNLRIALGGVLYSVKNYDEAIRLFQQAADLKPNLANAHYNLASAYREKNDLRNAVLAMQTVVNLVDRSTADYTKAVSELDDMRRKLGETTTPAAAAPATPAQSELQTPQPLPSPKITPPIELPSELGPETGTTPTPAAVTPSPTTPTPAPLP